jgi:hypothetical protein
MTWRRFWITLSIATLFIAAFGSQAPAYAGVDKAALLANLDSEQTVVRGWFLQVRQLVALGTDQRVMLGDLNVAGNALVQLRGRTVADTTAAALNLDSARFTSLHSSLISLEVPKIASATLANAGRLDFVRHTQLTRSLDLAGGRDPNSPIHAQTVALETVMGQAKADLDHGIALLDQATLSAYPHSLSLVASAQLAINRATAELVVVDQLAVQDQQLSSAIQGRIHLRDMVHGNVVALSKLRAQVSADPNLNAGERANLLGQINADLVALAQLDKWVVLAVNDTPQAALAHLMSEPGAFLVIRPKTYIMLAGAADRSAIAKLTAVEPTLQSRIAAAAAKHKDVTHLNALLTDMTAQLTAASAEIAPIDAEFESMTAFTATQLNSDGQVIRAANAALSLASNQLALATNDAGQILAATA